ncbi:hypothetical protein V6N11_021413 [Hibiscus sabdariffa]|uniref:Uncharacterized protein n=1 Tax=Hibiscus sabdariffa TaxID=183260 RepID=A0ABR1ZYB3_9ROSI
MGVIEGIRFYLVVGMCTDICVLDFVSSTLSAQNHSILTSLKDVIAYSSAFATFNLLVHVARHISGALAHPQDPRSLLLHHIDLMSIGHLRLLEMCIICEFELCNHAL